MNVNLWLLSFLQVFIDSKIIDILFILFRILSVSSHAFPWIIFFRGKLILFSRWQKTISFKIELIIIPLTLYFINWSSLSKLLRHLRTFVSLVIVVSVGPLLHILFNILNVFIARWHIHIVAGGFAVVYTYVLAVVDTWSISHNLLF